MINIYKTESRGAIVVMLVMVIAYFILKLIPVIKTKNRISGIFLACITIVAIILTIVLSFPFVKNLVTGRTKDEMDSSKGRFVQLQTSIPLIFKKPLMGYGPNPSGIIARFISNASIDNYYLVLALESGLITLILFIYIFIHFIRLSIIMCYELSGFPKALTNILGLSLISFVTFKTMLSIGDLFPLIFLSFAMLITLKEAVYDSDSRKLVSDH
jgi:hypothetical protein